MRGFVGISTILILVAILAIFGNMIVNSIEGGILCGMGRECDTLLSATGGTILNSEIRVKDAVYAIENPETYADIPNREEYTNWLRYEIIFGVATTIIIIVILWIILMKVTPSSRIDLFAKVIALVLAILIIGLVQVAYSTFVEGRATMPYPGMASLIAHPGAILSTIDWTEVGPPGMNLTNVSETVNMT